MDDGLVCFALAGTVYGFIVPEIHAFDGELRANRWICHWSSIGHIFSGPPSDRSESCKKSAATLRHRPARNFDGSL